MGSTLSVLVRAALMLLTDGGARRAVGRVLAVILSPLIVLVITLYALGSGAANHNAATVRLCFGGGPVPAGAPEEYRLCVEQMQVSFGLLDNAAAALQLNMEDGSNLDATWVKAVFSLCTPTVKLRTSPRSWNASSPGRSAPAP